MSFPFCWPEILSKWITTTKARSTKLKKSLLFLSICIDLWLKIIVRWRGEPSRNSSSLSEKNIFLPQIRFWDGSTTAMWKSSIQAKKYKNKLKIFSVICIHIEILFCPACRCRSFRCFILSDCLGNYPREKSLTFSWVGFFQKTPTKWSNGKIWSIVCLIVQFMLSNGKVILLQI